MLFSSHLRVWSVLLWMFCGCHLSEAFFDAITIGAASLLGGLVYTGKLDVLKDYTYCKVVECCNDHHIKLDVQGMS